MSNYRLPNCWLHTCYWASSFEVFSIFFLQLFWIGCIHTEFPSCRLWWPCSQARRRWAAFSRKQVSSTNSLKVLKIKAEGIHTSSYRSFPTSCYQDHDASNLCKESRVNAFRCECILYRHLIKTFYVHSILFIHIMYAHRTLKFNHVITIDFLDSKTNLSI